MYAVIGDVHGCFKTLTALVEKIPKDHKLVFVGDLIDRGPLDKDVVDFVKNNNHICVMANHEHMAVDSFLSTDIYGSDVWFTNGGRGVHYFGNDRLEWMRKLPLYWECGIKDNEGKTLLVSHGGVLDSIEFCTDARNLSSVYGHLWNIEKSIIWHRQEVTELEGVFQIYGHSPVKEPQISDHCANIDTGCVYGYTRVIEERRLTAMLWPSHEIIQQDYCDGVKPKSAPRRG
jgi:serine/threonine protein phosphatase 1